MPQLTNLNTFPYFDDFDESNNFYKVLFKPGQPVQARELTTLQSIVQNQVEQFGNHIFKEGSVVIPGSLVVSANQTSLELQRTFNGLDITQYLSSLVGKNIVGSDSGVKAKIEGYQDTHVIVSLLEGGTDNEQQEFEVDEDIFIQEAIPLTDAAITSFSAGASVATVKQFDAGCVAKLTEGVFFLRGYFVKVAEQFLIISTTEPEPSFTLGFEIEEDFVSSYDDESLYDNSQGFVNFAAPGADRLKITAKMVAIIDGDEIPQNFIELAKVENGAIKSSKVVNPEYNILADEMARRTYDESGDYYVKPFSLEVKNSLQDFKGSDGIYAENETTQSGETPRDDLAVYQLSSGKAYVQGYEVNIPSGASIDILKPRTTKEFKSQAVEYATGSTLRLNNVYGAPKIGLSTTYTLSLRSERVGSAATIAAGKEIGLARVYDYALETGSYDTSNPLTNSWDLTLFDVVPFTDLTLNQNLTSQQIPTFIEGKSSGAIGYLRYEATNTGIITAYNVTGNFIKGEELIFNGEDSDRIVLTSTNYGISNVKSVHGEIGITTFSGDVKQTSVLELGECTFSGG